MLPPYLVPQQATTGGEIAVAGFEITIGLNNFTSANRNFNRLVKDIARFSKVANVLP